MLFYPFCFCLFSSVPLYGYLPYIFLNFFFAVLRIYALTGTGTLLYYTLQPVPQAKLEHLFLAFWDIELYNGFGLEITFKSQVLQPSCTE